MVRKSRKGGGGGGGAGPREPRGRPVRRRLPVWKRAAFAVVTVAGACCLVEGGLWVFGVRPLHRSEDPYVGFAASSPLFVPDRGGSMTTAENKLPWFNRQTFRREKGPGEYRIFSLGGSTTYGHPYRDPTSFSGWLREFLPAADGGRKWTVVNAGGISYASYRVARLTEELAGYGPDLFIVYAGHNEFLEERTYGEIAAMSPLLRETAAVLGRTRTYTAVRSLVRKLSGSAGPAGGPRRSELAGEVEEILSRTSGPTTYTRDDALRERVLAHYRFSLGRIVQVARAAGARVIFVLPPSNLKDCSPFKSQHAPGLSDAQRTEWARLVEEARSLQAEGRPAEALERCLAAGKIDPRHAAGRYLTGKVLMALKRHDEAKAEFAGALDEDICPLRALGEMRDILLAVARENDVPVVDFTAMLEARCLAEHGHGVLGGEYFLDHVHPTVEANRLLGLALVERLAEMGIVRAGPSWDDAARRAVTERVLAGIDPKAQGEALHNLAKVINWGGKHEDAAGIAERGLALDPTGPEASGSALMVGALRERQKRLEEAAAWYARAVALNGDNAQARRFLGSALARTGRAAEAEGHYLHALRLEPRSLDALQAMGHIRFRQGRHAEAAEYYRQAADLFGLPGQARADHAAESDVRFNLGLALARLGRSDQAADQFAQVLRLNPADAAAHNELGRLRAAQGRWAEAAACFSKALQLNPGFAEARENFQAALRRQGPASRPG